MPWHKHGNIYRSTVTGAAEIHGINRRQPFRIQRRASRTLAWFGFLRGDVLQAGTVTRFASDTEHGVFRIEVAGYGRCGGMTAETSPNDLVVDGIAEGLPNITRGRGLMARRNVQSTKTGVVAEPAFQKKSSCFRT